MQNFSMGIRAIAFAVILGVAPFVTPIAFADHSPCGPASQVGETCLLRIDWIRPTQFAVGYRAVALKERELSSMSPGDLSDEIKGKAAPLVIGPGGSFYILDRHHLALALLGIGVQTMHAQVQANWSRLQPASFFPAMERNHWLWLHDENGMSRDPRELPLSLRRMTDDPYRSLADAVQEAGGYKKSDVPFADFLWSDFFRTRIQIQPGEAGFEYATRQAFVLAFTPAARDLPGYRGSR